MTTATKRLTVSEYLAMERASLEKHDFVDGEVVAMTGASREHNLIATNLVRLVGNHLRDRPCEIYAADMRVHIPRAKLRDREMFTYPDIVVACGGPKFLDNTSDTLLNPTLIIEVLSPSTENYDRGLKWKAYRTIPSLVEYVMVSQDSRFVERYLRQPDKQWLLMSMEEGSLRLSSVDCVLPLDEIYLKVPFPPDA